MGAASKIKTLIVEDSGFMRIFLSDILRKESDIEVVGTARNGQEGLEKIKNLNPDVVITDMMMPDFDGVYLVKKVMKESPVPIIIVSALDRADPQVFEALRYGAIDFIDKPDNSKKNRSTKKLIDLIKVSKKAEAAMVDPYITSRNNLEHTFDGRLNYDIILIGASTGGPGAIELIIQALPKNLSVPVVICQHMPPRFLETFAARIAKSTSNKVLIPENGDTIESGTIYLMPGTNNTILKRNVISGAITFEKSEQKFKEFNNPSIDAVFLSAAEIYGSRTIGTILTGMGRDGTIGLQAIKALGGYTIVQDEATSVVYGMPKSALDSGCAEVVLPLNEMAGYIVSCLG